MRDGYSWDGGCSDVEARDGRRRGLTRREFILSAAGLGILGASVASGVRAQVAGDSTKDSPVAQPVSGTGRPLIDIVSEDRFRTTAACLLLTPYVELGLSERLPHPMRARVASAIERHRDHPCARMFRDHVSGGNFGGQFYSLSAWLSPCPPFGWTAPLEVVVGSHIPPSIKGLATEAYPERMTAFHRDAGLAGLWDALGSESSWIYQQCRAALERWRVEEWMLSFWGPSPKRLVFVPNPTDPPTFGFGPSNRQESFAILGPPAVPKQTPDEQWAGMFDYSRTDDLGDLVIHEFGHTYLRTVEDGIGALAKETADIAASLELKGRFPRTYADWPEQLEETIIRAVEGLWRAEVISQESAHLGIHKDAERYGLTVLPPIFDAMTEARAQRTTLRAAGVLEAAARGLARYRNC